jgi:Mn-dependent DtxR family transcriptional regulator
LKNTQALENQITKLQGQYLAFIVAYAKLNRRAPAEADFQRYFKVTPPSVHNMIVTLERHGLIKRTPGRPRSIEVLVPLNEIPPLD